jgi:hypothetical protein
LLGALTAGAVSCAKAPPLYNVPYDGYVGTGKDWNASVDRVEFTVDPRRTGPMISPLIYGWNDLRNDPTRVNVGSLRAGGNRYTAYNWENNASNAGNDYMFQSDGYLVNGSAMGDVPGEAVRPLIEAAARLGAGAIVTVPNVDYVAADKAGGGDVRSSGADYLMTRFKRNMPTKGAPFTATPDTTDGFVYQDEFVAWAKGLFPNAQVLFGMDNEPDLWSKTHAAIHPAKVTYEEVVTRNRDFARAVKAVWPTAPVLGFVSYGWQGFTTLENAPDLMGNFVDYYLKQMKAAEAAEGQRLIDYLDLHWYPEAQGNNDSGAPVRIVFNNATGPGIVEARVQAPRSLWDPGYKERSWISGTVAGGAVALIPRMQNKIEEQYPGTILAFTEWNYGGGGEISGGVATADVLGVFGREGVGVANLWPVGAETFSMAAFAVYRNYDGQGAKFGDRSIAAETSSIYSSSVYASIDSANPSRVVIVAINKRDAATTAAVRITGDTTSAFAQVFVLTGEGAMVRPAPALTAASPGTFEYQMPPLSVSVLVPTPTMP